MKHWNVIVLSVIFTVLGAIAGSMATRAKQQPSTSAIEPKATASVAFSETTLKSLGVTVKSLAATRFERTISIAATIRAQPGSERAVFAPIGGRIIGIEVRPGELVRAGGALATIVRDPIPRPELPLTGPLLQPAGEALHEAVSDLRRAMDEVRIVEAELARVASFTGSNEDMPLLPRRNAIDLEYQRVRAQRTLDQTSHELEKHGFSDEQVAALGAGGSLTPMNAETWTRILQHNGLWSGAAGALLDALPSDVRERPWVVATCAELAIAALADEPLRVWLAETPTAGGRFLEVATLLQRGYSVADVRDRFQLGALEPVVVLRAPEGEAPDWDVSSVSVRVGAVVAAGDRVLTLLDSHAVHMDVTPLGSETGPVLTALIAQRGGTAHPLVPGTGPELSNVVLSAVQTHDEHDGTRGIASVANRVLATTTDANGATRRSWALRPGLEYRWHVATEAFESVYVVPSDAITNDGPRRVVLRQDGDSFDLVEVEVMFEDGAIALLPGDRGKVFPGDRIAHSGAYALSIALRGASSAGAHQGHSH